MKTILVVEDEQVYIELYKDIFDRLNVDLDKCVFFKSASEANAWIDKYGENLATAFLDLKVPLNQDGKVRDSKEDSTFGFDVLRNLRAKNRNCHAVIVSNYADEKRERDMIKGLRRQDVIVDAVLHKQLDLDMENLKGIDRFRTYVEPVDQEIDLLKRAGIYANHPCYEKIVRQMKLSLQEGQQTWPSQFYLFHGVAGSGKNCWARALAILKANHPKEYIFEQESLAALTDPLAGDSVALRLFGARDYERLNKPGLFERATRYKERSAGLARPEDTPSYSKSGVAFLDELDSAPLGVVDSLLNVMSEGVVHTRGVGSQEIKIGCMMIFASIEGEKGLNEENTVQRGAGALNAFIDRIPSSNRIRLPSLKELGARFAVDFLSFKAGREVLLQPAAEDLLLEGIEAGKINIRELAMMKIPNSYRLTYEEVSEVFDDQLCHGREEGLPTLFSGKPSIEVAEAWSWLDAMQESCTKVLASGQRLSKDVVGKNLVSPKSGKGVSPQRISQVFNSEDFSTVLLKLLEENSDRWPDVKSII